MKSSPLNVHIRRLFLLASACTVAFFYPVQVVRADEPCSNFEYHRDHIRLHLSENDVSGNSKIAPLEEYTREEPSIFRILRNDIAYLLRESDFYSVIGGLSAAPSFIEYEPKAIDRGWMRSVHADRFFEAGEIIGNAVVPFSIALASYSIGKCFDSPKTLSFASDLFRTNVINGLLTMSMKLSIHRKRPDGAQYSYPSGHTSHAFATAGVISSHYGPWAGALSDIAAIYIGLSRLQENKHYLSDVIGGAILGSYVAYKITHRDEDTGHIGIIPIFEGKTYGAGITLNF